MFSFKRLLGKIFKRNGATQQDEFDKKLVFKLSKKRIPRFNQLKYLFHFLNPKEQLWTKIFFGAAVLCLIFLGVRYYFVHLKIHPRAGGEYIEGLVGSPRFINPVLSPLNDADQDIAKLIFSGLLKYDKSEKLVPELAENYQISEDQKTYTFYLKQNILWHDDKPFTAKDVAFTVNLIKNPEIKSPLFSSLYGVEVETPDDFTIKFTLAEPYAPFLSILTFGILPEHIWSSIPANQFTLTEYNLKPIGNGPFKFKSLTKDKLGSIKSYSLERNKEYFQEPYLKSIIFKFYPSQEDALIALKNKNVQGAIYLQQDWQEILGKAKDVNKYSLYLPQYTALFINQKNNSILESLTVRKVLALSINKQEIIKKALAGQGEIIYGPIASWSLGYNPDVEKYEFSPEQANQLLDDAKWEKSDQGIRTKDDQELKIILTTLDRPNYIKAAELIEKFWEDLGIVVDLNIISTDIFQKEVIKTKSYEILLHSIISGFDPDPYAVWHSSQTENSGLNLALYKNRKVDKLLGEARTTANPDERAEKYKEFQNILAEDLPAIFLYNSPYNYFVDKKVRGIEIEKLSVPQDRLANIEEWFVKVKRWFK